MKGSGSTLLTRLLNKHPDVLITNESDIVWILYQLANYNIQSVGDFHKFYEDGDFGMLQTLHQHPKIVEFFKKHGIQETFHLVQGKRKVVGDKKPHQHSNLAVQDFVKTNFANAKFVYLVRHPKAVICSKSRDNQFSMLHRLERYCRTDRNVENLEPKIVIRYEDLCERPNEIMSQLFQFLEVSPLATDFQELIYKGANDKYAHLEVLDWQLVENINEILKNYDYIW